MRFWPEVPPVFMSLIMNVSFFLSNWLKMYKMRCIRQIEKHYFQFLPYLIEISILAFLGFAWRKRCTILMEMNVDIIQLWTFIKFLWNALRSSNLVWWYIIIVLIHSFTQWRHMTLSVIFKVIDIGYKTFGADLGEGYLRVIFERFCPRTYYFLNSHWMGTDRKFIWENIWKL